MTHLEIIRLYFDCWLSQNPEYLPQIFSKDIVYTECYGPQYQGIEQILHWFRDWNKIGKVLEWNLLETWDYDDTLIVKWFFRYKYQNNSDCFDGISLIHFDELNKICSIEEFKSVHIHVFPYN